MYTYIDTIKQKLMERQLTGFAAAATETDREPLHRPALQVTHNLLERTLRLIGVRHVPRKWREDRHS